MELGLGITGIHHITLVAGNAERTARFYVHTLGLGFVKKTVNFDRPSTYHLHFGDLLGTPGTLVTFIEWPDSAPGRIDGHILEIATTVPGFLVDQSTDRLGIDLALPDWLEPQRETIEAGLSPIRLTERVTAGQGAR